MNRAPLLVSKRNDGWALQSRQHVDYLLQASLGDIHSYILLVLGAADGLETEKHLLKRPALVSVHILVANQQGLALHHHLHLAEVVAYEGRAAADYVEDSVSKADARRDFHTARDDVNLSLYAVIFHKMSKYARI